MARARVDEHRITTHNTRRNGHTAGRNVRGQFVRTPSVFYRTSPTLALRYLGISSIARKRLVLNTVVVRTHGPIMVCVRSALLLLTGSSNYFLLSLCGALSTANHCYSRTVRFGTCFLCVLTGLRVLLNSWYGARALVANSLLLTLALCRESTLTFALSCILFERISGLCLG